MCDCWKPKFRMFYQRVKDAQRSDTPSSSIEALRLWADGYDAGYNAALDAILLAIQDFVGESEEEMTK